MNISTARNSAIEKNGISPGDANDVWIDWQYFKSLKR